MTHHEKLHEHEEGKVLVVDDEEVVRDLLARILQRQGWSCVAAGDAEEARRCIEKTPFALVLTDLGMPGASGLDLIQHIVAHHPDTATVMVTGRGDAGLGKNAIEVGAYGYLTKPFHPDDVLVTVFNALRRRSLEVEARNHRDELEKMVKARTAQLWEHTVNLELVQRELRSSQEETIHRLSLAAEGRAHETGQHIERMSRYCGLLSRLVTPDDDRAEQLRLASLMHDVGKIGTPDKILLKPRSLSAEERQVIQRHCEIGRNILAGSSSELLQVAATIAYTHHERWDGRGYPQGLSGAEIPIEGRIAAIADVFDALTSQRVYRKPSSIRSAVQTMRDARGLHFDPELLDLFLDAMPHVVSIKEDYND